MGKEQGVFRLVNCLVCPGSSVYDYELSTTLLNLSIVEELPMSQRGWLILAIVVAVLLAIFWAFHVESAIITFQRGGPAAALPDRTARCWSVLVQPELEDCLFGLAG
jgi:hypothetical protein